MRDEAEISARLEEVVLKEVSARVTEASEKLPHKCTHNYRHPLDARKRADGDANEGYNRISTDGGLPVLQTVGLCMLGAESPVDWGGTICDEPIDAKRCPYFTPTKTHDDITREVTIQMQDVDWVKENLPEAHGLLWVLGDITAPKLTWWAKLVMLLRRPKDIPTPPPFDSTKLLGPGD